MAPNAAVALDKRMDLVIGSLTTVLKVSLA